MEASSTPTKRHVAFAADQNFAVPLITAVYSYCRRNAPSVVHILHGDLSKATQSALSMLVHDCGHELVFHDPAAALLKSREGCTVSSVATCYRYLLADMLPEADQVLYVDADTLTLESLDDLFGLKLGNAYAAGCPDVQEGLDLDRLQSVAERLGVPLEELKAKYVNAGVLLLNTKKIRDEGLTSKFLALDAGETLLYRDQDVLNLTFAGKILHFSRLFNLIGIENYQGEDAPRLIHFTGRAKPWYVSVTPYHDAYRQTWRELTARLRELGAPDFPDDIAVLPLPSALVRARTTENKIPAYEAVLRAVEALQQAGDSKASLRSAVATAVCRLHRELASQGQRDKQLDYYLLGVLNALTPEELDSLPGKEGDILRFLRRHQRKGLKTLRLPWGGAAVWMSRFVN